MLNLRPRASYNAAVMEHMKKKEQELQDQYQMHVTQEQNQSGT